MLKASFTLEVDLEGFSVIWKDSNSFNINFIALYFSILITLNFDIMKENKVY